MFHLDPGIGYVTFLLGPGRSLWIYCVRCRHVSHNPNDVSHLYCGFCRRFHEDTDLWMGEGRVEALLPRIK